MKRVLTATAFVVLVGCRAGESAARGVVTRDSAGIRITDNPTVAPDLGWQVDSLPTLEIGGANAPESHSVFQVGGAFRLSDGRVVVANGGTAELRFYGRDGAYIRAAGRRGEGPGEFQQITWVGRLDGDSIITYDTRLLRFSVFDSAGTFARSFRLSTTEDVRFASVIGMYADGSFLAQGFAQTGQEVPSGLQRYPAPTIPFRPGWRVAGPAGHLFWERGLL